MGVFSIMEDPGQQSGVKKPKSICQSRASVRERHWGQKRNISVTVKLRGKTEESKITELSSNISTCGKASLTHLPKRAEDPLFGLL